MGSLIVFGLLVFEHGNGLSLYAFIVRGEYM